MTASPQPGEGVRSRVLTARGLALALAAVCFWLTPSRAVAATFTAALDRDTITLGESATLSLTFGGSSSQNAPNLPSIPNLQLSYVGPSSQFSFINGQVSSTVTHNFTVTPRQAGEFSIPAFAANVGAERLTSQPLTLKVLKPNAPPPEAIKSGSEPAFLKLVLPKKQVYVGEMLTGELQLYLGSGVQNISRFQLTGFPADGFNVGKMVEGNRRNVQVGNAAYTVIPIYFPVKAVKTGASNLGPVTASVVVELASGRRRDPFLQQFGFDFFGGGEQRQLSLASEPAALQSLPLPGENVPPAFNGAVGNYTMTVTAGPTNLAQGDPITLRVQIAGRGAFDSLNLPPKDNWQNFRAYPPSSKIETTDNLGLQGSVTFEQIVVPLNPDVRELPPVSFSYFDPDQRAYRTLTQPAQPLVVRPASAAVPTVLAASRTAQDNSPPSQDIVPNKQRLGSLAQVGPPLVLQPWFVALQGLPVLAFVSTVVWRKRSESLANNPRLRRQRLVAKILRDGLEQMRRLAAEKKSDDFFAMMFHLLQEQLGERLDLPASAITEAVIDEHLRPRRVADALLASLQELFQTCNLARYAPVKSSQELAAMIPKLESVLRDLQQLKT